MICTCNLHDEADYIEDGRCPLENGDCACSNGCMGGRMLLPVDSPDPLPVEIPA